MTLRATSSLCAGLFIVTLILSFSSVTSLGQTTAARPDRGTMPTGDYAVSSSENISLSNGNMNLSIPLASLPAIAGGKLSFGINATYNSKLWNITRTEADAPDNEYHPYVIDTPQLSDSAGWQITGQYIISIRDAHEDFDYQTEMPLESMPYTEYNLRVNYEWYKVVITMPDGSEHELRPIDYTPYVAGDEFLHGYYKETPYNINTAMRYYSFDGSFLYATMTNLSNWTVYTPDGMKVIQTPDGIQRIQDTNGNKIKIFSDSNGTHYQDEQTGREIRYSYNPSGNGGQGQGTVTYQTVGGTQEYIYINFGYTTVQGQLYKVKDWISYQLHECNRNGEVNQQIHVIREIVLPVTEPGVMRKFTFSYNSDSTESATSSNVRFTCSDSPHSYTRTASKGWGELSQMQTPTDAIINYAYSLDAPAFSAHSLIANDDLAEEYLKQKRTTHDGTTDTWIYSVDTNSGSVTNPDGSNVTEDKYSHSPGFAYSVGKAGLVYRTTKPFTKTERHWTHLEFSGANTISPSGTVDFNPVVDFEYTTLLDASNNPLKMSAKAYQYDYSGNLLQTTDYDWFDPALVSRDTEGVPTGVPASATVLRVTSNSYYNPATSSTSGNVYAKRSITTGTPLILNAPQQTSAGPSVTQFSYDGQSYGAAPTAGNLTTVSRLDNRGDSNPGNDVWTIVSNTYGPYGNMATTTDARGNVTQFYYDDAIHAKPTRIVVDPQNGTGQQTTATAYDYNTGAITSVTDPNGNTTTTDYTNQLISSVDPFARPCVVIGPAVTVNGTPQHLRIKKVYQDSARKVTVTSDLNTENDGLLKSETLSDQLGRSTETRQYETGATYITVKQIYDSMGRASQVSNPYRAGSTVLWTTTTYDSLDRVLTVTTPDSAVATSSYSGNQVTVTDQKGKSRSSVADALGRITQVIEDPNGLAYSTNYSYDVMGNLSTVTQGTQHRYFMYDSLSKLVRVKNPEQDANASLALSDPVSGNGQWSIGYSYDANGNLATKTDARGVTSTYTYDGLNRNTVISYSDGSHIDRLYDIATNGRGRLFHSVYYPTSGAYSVTAIDTYDAMGRPLYQRQHFYASSSWGPAYVTQRAYDLAGHVTSQIYPSGRTVSYTYDLAGRTSSFAGNLGDGVTRTYAGSITYDEWNGLSREQFGTDTSLYHKEKRNIRGQLYDMRLSTVNDSDNWNRGAIVNYYSFQPYGWGTSGPDNNSNLLVQQHWVPGDDAISTYSLMQQNYDYDALNRLIWVGEYQNAVTNTGGQNYSYDRYGNRSMTGWGTGINNQQFTVDTNTNRLGVPSGQSEVMQYDAAGNLYNDTYSGAGTRTFDAENRMVSATSNAGQQSIYNYDADGRRVRRNSYGQETWQAYDMDGELEAEYAAGASPSSPQKEYGYRNGQLLIAASGQSCGVGYQGTKTWTATSSSLGHVIGHQDGSDWVANVSTDSANFMVYGPYDSTFGQGHHTARFLLQVDNTSGSDVVATIDVVTGYGSNYLAQRQIRRNEFTAANQWQWFTLEFDNPCFGVLEARVFWRDAVNMRFSQSTITGVNSAGGTVEWMVPDQLGTPRMIADKTGSLAGIKRHDYLPFGEELYVESGGRTEQQGYVGDNVRQKFTQKERDSETGLDYFEARYYGSIQGRFTSADPYDINIERQSMTDGKKAEEVFDVYIRNPQQWNKYTYVVNNPLKYVDPEGEDIELIGNEEERQKQFDDLKRLVGPRAASYLYVQAVPQPDGTTRYFVCILDGGPTGKGPKFEDINDVAGEIGPIIRDSNIVGLEIFPPGYKDVEDDYHIVTRIAPAGQGGSPGATMSYRGRLIIFLLDPTKNQGVYPSRDMEGNASGVPVRPEYVLAHELGRARARMTGDPNETAGAIRIERKAMRLHNPRGPLRRTELPPSQ